VYERGTGFTLACGSAATATAAVAIEQGKCEGEVVISMPGGDCTVAWPDKSDLYLSGPATTVYSGVWNG
jgi:diaminopimelate epimerase